MVTAEQPTLVLFDIDGTLLHSNGSGRAAFMAALREVFELTQDVAGLRFAGATDRSVLYEALGPLGFAPAAVDARLPAFSAAMARQLAAIIADFAVQALPGALALVRDLYADPRARLGLVTGNVGLTAPIKLRAAGFDPAHFPVGAYGDEAADRSDLPPLAVQRAAVYWGHAFAAPRIVIIGDTPNDVICARSVGARALAVLTGGEASRAALAAAAPAAILPDLTDRALVEAAIFGED